MTEIFEGDVFECWVCNDGEVVVSTHGGTGPCVCVPWKRKMRRMANVAEWAERYDGEIAGAIRDVLEDGEMAEMWDEPAR